MFQDSENMSDIDRILGTLSLKLIECEDRNQKSFKELEMRIRESFESSMNGESIYEDPNWLLKAIDEEEPDVQTLREIFSCQNQMLLKDWMANHQKYELQENDIMLDMKVTSAKVKEYIKTSEQKFIKDREMEYREKKREILKISSNEASSPLVQINSLLKSSFRKTGDQISGV